VRLRTFAAVAARGRATVAQYVYDWFNASGYVAWGAVPVSPGAGFISTSGIAGVPTVGGGHVFAPGAGGTLEGGFDASGASCPPDRISGVRICSPAWTANIGANLSPIAYAGSTIYTGASNGNLYAFASNGCTMSPCPSPWIGATGGALTAPAVANGLVYVGSADRRLYAFDAAGCGRSACAPIWSMTTHASVSSAPSVANGVVYVGSDDGRLYAVAASGCGTTTCAPLWRSAPGAAIRTAPAIAGGTVSVGRIDGSLTVYRTRT
jgi:outer membrane protein assembly factor BamB